MREFNVDEINGKFHYLKINSNQINCHRRRYILIKMTNDKKID